MTEQYKTPKLRLPFLDPDCKPIPEMVRICFWDPITGEHLKCCKSHEEAAEFSKQLKQQRENQE
jgi:hypothetical protein